MELKKKKIEINDGIDDIQSSMSQYESDESSLNSQCDNEYSTISRRVFNSINSNVLDSLKIPLIERV